MPLTCWSRIKPGELAGRLEALDIDEGIRIEQAGNKMFVNKSASGIFVVQFGNSDDFHYLESARQVIALARSRLGGKTTAWIY